MIFQTVFPWYLFRDPRVIEVHTCLVLVSIPGVPAAHHLTGEVLVNMEFTLYLSPGERRGQNQTIIRYS